MVRALPRTLKAIYLSHVRCLLAAGQIRTPGRVAEPVDRQLRYLCAHPYRRVDCGDVRREDVLASAGPD